MQTTVCPICQSSDFIPFQTFQKPVKNYFQCSHCEFVQLSEDEMVSFEAERLRYEHHENQDSPGYRSFFQALLKQVQVNLAESIDFAEKSSFKGLDYGCGPFKGEHPFLVGLLREIGYSMDYFDPYFYAVEPSGAYDFIVSTEVIEHIQDPFTFLNKMKGLLKPQGWIFLMTSPFVGRNAFESWSYRRDETHISFYNEKNMKLLAKRCGLKLKSHHNNLFVLQNS